MQILTLFRCSCTFVICDFLLLLVFWCFVHLVILTPTWLFVVCMILFFFYNCCVVRQILISILLTLRRRRHYTIWTLGKMDKAVWTQKAVVREAGFLAVGEACKAIFWPAPGRRERTFASFLLSAEGTFNFCVLRVSFLHLHPSLNREGRWGTTGDVTASFLQFSLFSTALWDLPNSRPVHSLTLSSYLFLCLPRLLPPFTVPCTLVLARPNERETCPYHFSSRLFTMSGGLFVVELPAGSLHGLPRW